MAYRRRQGIRRASTFKEEIHHPTDHDHKISSSSSFNSSLASKAVRASAYRDSSPLSSAYGNFSFDASSARISKEPATYDYTSFKSSNEAPKGFWGVLALKAKSILEDDAISQHSTASSSLRPQPLETYSDSQFNRMQGTSESNRRIENSRLRTVLDAVPSSINNIGNAMEEERSTAENKPAEIIQETRKLQIRRKGNDSEEQIHVSESNPSSSSVRQGNYQSTQLKASRDVALATAAKAKLLLRELKTIKADLAFARERCTQLEEENKILREAREKGVNPADDDMIRLQLETLLNEKSRLANENSIYARENLFLREIVEYHQLTMQDVVYLDEEIEQVYEEDPIPAVSGLLSISPPSPSSPRSPLHDATDLDSELQTVPSAASQPPPPPPPPPRQEEEEDRLSR